jgi:hypothetical protein
MQHNIRFDGPILPGSVSTARGRCGKKRCACKAHPPRLHGPYRRWTGFLKGKRTTITLTKDEAEECKRRIRHFRKLQQEIDKLILTSLAKAPWLTRT